MKIKNEQYLSFIVRAHLNKKVVTEKDIKTKFGHDAIRTRKKLLCLKDRLLITFSWCTVGDYLTLCLEPTQAGIEFILGSQKKK